jgi:hypothetical protein
MQPPVFSVSTSAVPNGSLLDLVFINVSDLSVSISDFSTVSPDKYDPPLLLDFQLMLHYS